MKIFLRIAAVIVCLFVVAASGCSTYKEDFEKAKGTISELEGKIRSLSEREGKLTKEVGDLQQKSEKLVKEKSDLTDQLDRIQKDNSALSKGLKQLKKRCAEFEKTVGELKKENEKLSRDNKDLRDQLSTLTRARESTAEALKPQGTPAGARKAGAESVAASTPCDALVEYMRKSAAITRGASGEELAKRLDALKSEYKDKLQGVPPKAVAAAEAWLSEVVRFLTEKPSDDAVFRILTKRNTALKACGKTPEEGGF